MEANQYFNHIDEKSIMRLRMSGNDDEDLSEINKEIATLNNQMITNYVDAKTQELTNTVTKFIKKLDDDRIAQIRANNLALKQGKEVVSASMLKEVKKTQVEPPNPDFIDSMKSLLSYVTTFNQLLTESKRLDLDIKKRLESALLIIQKTLSEAVTSKNWIFKETDEVNLFISEYYNVLIVIKKRIIELNQVGCNVICNTSTGKQDIKNQLMRLENKIFAFPIFFKLTPRMTQHITQQTSNKEIVEPDPLALDSKAIGKEIRAKLQNDFPELEPILQLRVEEKIKYVENEKIITKKAKKASFVKAQECFYGFGQPQNYKLAVKYYLKAENKGVVEASNCLGKMYLDAKGVQKNDQKAYEHFKKSADAEDQDGQYYIGYMIEHDLIKGFSPVNRLEEAVKFYKKAAARNQTDALTDLGFLTENGLVGEPNYQRAQELYKSACEMKNPRAMNNLASLYLKGVMPNMTKSQLEKEAFDLYERSAKLGYVKGLTNLGICYLKGIGVLKDTVNAKKLFKEGAIQKDPDAMFYLAYFKLKGASMNANDEEYFEAADQLRYVTSVDKNNSDAYYYLGYLYENGFGVDQDYKTSTFYYSKAVAVSNETNPKAMYKLGNMLYSGKAGYADMRRAYQLYAKAAELGDKDAIYTLGVLHEHGLSVEQNVETACKLYEQSAKMGHADAKVNLAMLMMKDKFSTSEFGTTPENLLLDAAKQGNNKAKGLLESTMNAKQPLFNTLPSKMKNTLNMTSELSYFAPNNTTQFLHLGDYMGKNST